MGKSHDLATLSDDGISSLKVDTIKSTGGTTAMSVDSSGRVLRSVLPAFRVGLDSNQNLSSLGPNKVTFNTDSGNSCFLQGGVTHNNGTITVPVAGLYQINAHMRVDDVSAGYYIILYIAKNQVLTGLNTGYFLVDEHGPSYHTMVGTDLHQCEANDELECYLYVQSDTNYHVEANRSLFSGFLVG